MIEKELIKKYIYTNPIALLAIKDKESIDFINSFLPYSAGFEIECNTLADYNYKNFEVIPDILDCGKYNSNQITSIEVRYRIPNGLQGLVCLFNICNELHRNCSLSASSIHYHIDCTDVFDEIHNQNWINDNNNWIIERLKLWETAKDYNANCKVSLYRAWVRLADEHSTIEFRIGEMTFDYNIIAKRILDCNDIVKKIKQDISTKREVTYNKVDITKILNYLKIANTTIQYKNFELLKQELEKQSKELKQQSIIINPDIDMKKVINSRIKKFV
jgi:hypothetical protein